jgi:uncharacterized membrane protein
MALILSLKLVLNKRVIVITYRMLCYRIFSIRSGSFLIKYSLGIAYTFEIKDNCRALDVTLILPFFASVTN